MAQYTRNGWVYAPSARTAIRGPGTSDTGEVRAGDVATIFQDFVDAFDSLIEPVTTINGYRTPAYNETVGGDPASNHMSATALDINGAKHPYERALPESLRGSRYPSGFTAAQTSAVRKLLLKYKGMIRWGLDFNIGYRDAMHFEIAGTPAQVAAFAKTLIGEQDMDLTPQNLDDIATAVVGKLLNYANPSTRPNVYALLIAAAQNGMGVLSVQRDGKAVSALQELADIKTIVSAPQETIDAARLAEALKPYLSNVSPEEVADEVLAKLGSAITNG